MADQIISQLPYVISATDNYVLSDGDAAVGSSFCLHFQPDVDWSGSVTLKGRARITNPATDLTGTDATDREWLAIPYRKLFLNGTVADDAFDNVAITTTSIIVPIIDGLEISLDATVSAGTITVYGSPILA